jgi:crotonobetainyl-CoA:carnitine CoA-transferase CaiB-like acyl-CoA transferase
MIEQDDVYKPSAEWDSDMSLGNYPLPQKWAEIISARIKDVMILRTSREWNHIFGEGQFPGTSHRWLQEWMYDFHPISSGLVLKVDDPEIGRMVQPGPMVWLQESAELRANPYPRRYVSFEDALAAFNDIPSDVPLVTKPDDRCGWLDGVRILDLCNVIAGPHSCQYLTRFGAEVIHIAPSTPNYDPSTNILYGLTNMQSKRSVLADMSTPEGREIIEKLVATVDVVAWNATDRQVKKFGLTPENLQRINPNVIFCQLDCFSGIREGPRTNHLGYDDLVQATTGIMLRFGGSMDSPEEHAHVGTIDVMCGFGAALGIATALYQRERTGIIGHPRTSLAALSGLAQIPFFYDFMDRHLFDEPSGPSVPGYDELTRFYYASDRPLLFATNENLIHLVEKLPEFKGFSEVPKDRRSNFLARIFIRGHAEYWVEQLQSVGIGAAICNTIESIRPDNTKPFDGSTGIDRGSYSFSTRKNHPCGYTVTQLDPYAVRPVRSKIYAMTPPEKFGASTRPILLDLGYTDSQIDGMAKANVISESWSKEYLPS